MNKSNSGKQNLCYPGSGLIMNLVDYVDTSINKKYRTTRGCDISLFKQENRSEFQFEILSGSSFFRINTKYR